MCIFINFYIIFLTKMQFLSDRKIIWMNDMLMLTVYYYTFALYIPAKVLQIKEI